MLTYLKGEGKLITFNQGLCAQRLQAKFMQEHFQDKNFYVQSTHQCIYTKQK